MATDLIYLTLCSNNYLAQALTLFSSLKDNGMSGRMVLGLVDLPNQEIDYSVMVGIDIIRFDEIGINLFPEMLGRYDVVEFNTAVKPFFIKYLLEKHGVDSVVVYVDPDIRFYDNLNKHVELLRRYDVILTPMLTTVQDNVCMEELVALRHGMYNLGYIAVRYGSNSFSFLNWWSSRLVTHCVNQKGMGLFVDQKWVDLAPLLFEGLYIDKSPGYNMAWWNFNERRIINSENSWFVNDLSEPLVFFHFSGFKPGTGVFTGRIAGGEFDFKHRPDLVPLFVEYERNLFENDFARFSNLPTSLTFTDHSAKKQSGLGRILRRVARKIGL